MEYEFIKWLHILSATLLFGTGLGSAFYKWAADRSGNLQAIVHTNKVVVNADWIFTTPTVVIQPITGVWLTYVQGIPLSEPWVMLTLLLYAVAGGCWIPVVWLQIRMRDMAMDSLNKNADLSNTYHRYTQRWFWLGMPAFTSMIIIYFLMVYKPAIGA
ncbi:DUF2269 family protein [Pseudomonadota bacterium]